MKCGLANSLFAMSVMELDPEARRLCVSSKFCMADPELRDLNLVKAALVEVRNVEELAPVYFLPPWAGGPQGLTILDCG